MVFFIILLGTHNLNWPRLFHVYLFRALRLFFVLFFENRVPSGDLLSRFTIFRSLTTGNHHRPCRSLLYMYICSIYCGRDTVRWWNGETIGHSANCSRSNALHFQQSIHHQRPILSVYVVYKSSLGIPGAQCLYFVYIQKKVVYAIRRT